MEYPLLFFFFSKKYTAWALTFSCMPMIFVTSYHSVTLLTACFCLPNL